MGAEREWKGEERGWRWARINRRATVDLLPLFLEAEAEKAVYRLSRSLAFRFVFAAHGINPKATIEARWRASFC